MRDRREEIAGRIDAYLDGLMTVDERAAFERDVVTDAALGAEWALQQKVDASIRSRFAPPQSGGEGLSITPALRARSWRRLVVGVGAVAATIAAGAVIWMNVAPMLQKSTVTPMLGWQFVPISAADAYATQQARGFAPEWVCRNDEEFAQAVRKVVGTGMVLAATPGVEALGWAYNSIGDGKSRGVLSVLSLYLLARVDGQDVVVIVDRAEKDRAIEEPGSGLRVFRREVGGAVLYEVTPLDEARVAAQFVPVDEASE